MLMSTSWSQGTSAPGEVGGCGQGRPVRKVVCTENSSAWGDTAEQRVSACELGWANTSIARRHILSQWTECAQCQGPAGAAVSTYKAGCALRRREMEL